MDQQSCINLFKLEHFDAESSDVDGREVQWKMGELIEGEGTSETEEYIEIETTADYLDGSDIFHSVNDILGFILFMHQQIPAMMQDLSLEFDTLKMEYKELEMVLKQNEVKASLRRMHVGRMREVKYGIRRLEKLMSTTDNLRTALQLLIAEVPNIQCAVLVLGSTPMRPQYVYDLRFSCGKIVHGGPCNFTRNKAVEGLSKKAIRALISKGAGSSSYAGQSKLFLMVKAPPSISLPLHFLPKRDFKCHKKIVPFRLQFKSKASYLEKKAAYHDNQAINSTNMTDSSNDSIWFQCRHSIKGLASAAASTEE